MHYLSVTKTLVILGMSLGVSELLNIEGAELNPSLLPNTNLNASQIPEENHKLPIDEIERIKLPNIDSDYYYFANKQNNGDNSSNDGIQLYDEMLDLNNETVLLEETTNKTKTTTRELSSTILDIVEPSSESNTGTSQVLKKDSENYKLINETEVKNIPHLSSESKVLHKPQVKKLESDETKMTKKKLFDEAEVKVMLNEPQKKEIKNIPNSGTKTEDKNITYDKEDTNKDPITTLSNLNLDVASAKSSTGNNQVSTNFNENNDIITTTTHTPTPTLLSSTNLLRITELPYLNFGSTLAKSLTEISQVTSNVNKNNDKNDTPITTSHVTMKLQNITTLPILNLGIASAKSLTGNSQIFNNDIITKATPTSTTHSTTKSLSVTTLPYFNVEVTPAKSLTASTQVFSNENQNNDSPTKDAPIITTSAAPKVLNITALPYLNLEVASAKSFTGTSQGHEKIDQNSYLGKESDVKKTPLVSNGIGVKTNPHENEKTEIQNNSTNSYEYVTEVPNNLHDNKDIDNKDINNERISVSELSFNTRTTGFHSVELTTETTTTIAKLKPLFPGFEVYKEAVNMESTTRFGLEPNEVHEYSNLHNDTGVEIRENITQANNDAEVENSQLENIDTEVKNIRNTNKDLTTKDTDNDNSPPSHELSDSNKIFSQEELTRVATKSSLGTTTNTPSTVSPKFTKSIKLISFDNYTNEETEMRKFFEEIVRAKNTERSSNETELNNNDHYTNFSDKEILDFLGDEIAAEFAKADELIPLDIDASNSNSKTELDKTVIKNASAQVNESADNETDSDDNEILSEEAKTTTKLTTTTTTPKPTTTTTTSTTTTTTSTTTTTTTTSTTTISPKTKKRNRFLRRLRRKANAALKNKDVKQTTSQISDCKNCIYINGVNFKIDDGLPLEKLPKTSSRSCCQPTFIIKNAYFANFFKKKKHHSAKPKP